jgi:hypothetical protein
MAELAKATSSEPTGEPGRRSVLLDEQWSIGPKMHGGYLLAVLAQAAVDEVADGGVGPAHDVPEAVTGTFLRAPDPGPAALRVDVLRRGRGATQVRVRLDQDDRPCVEAGLVLGAVRAPDPREGDVSPAPIALPPFEECERRPVETPDGRGGLPLMEVVDARMEPGSLGFLSGRPSGEGRLSGWVELDTREAWPRWGCSSRSTSCPRPRSTWGSPAGRRRYR